MAIHYSHIVLWTCHVNDGLIHAVDEWIGYRHASESKSWTQASHNLQIQCLCLSTVNFSFNIDKIQHANDAIHQTIIYDFHSVSLFLYLIKSCMGGKKCQFCARFPHVQTCLRPLHQIKDIFYFLGRKNKNNNKYLRASSEKYEDCHPLSGEIKFHACLVWKAREK